MRRVLLVIAVLAVPNAAQARPLPEGPVSAKAARAAGAVLAANPDKPFCLGINTKPWEPYDGKCRYGVPTGPMQFMAANMNRPLLQRKLDGTRLPDRFQARLLRQVDRIGQSETPAEGQDEAENNARQGKKSWPKRASVNCLLFGSAVTGITLIIRAVFEQNLDLTLPLEAGTGACASFAANKVISRWTKKHGYDFED